ncbi:MAG: type VI secretion system protein TssA [Planctomycetes bacterium]|nr:type VI secretion system protein TssA [Planctomycetota bacterium]
MGSSEVLDFEALLAPIPGEYPTGIDLRQDPAPTSPYRDLKAAVARARTEARRKIAGEPDAAPDWNVVVEAAKAMLSGASKDLVVATWLAEALLHEHGFGGLRDGFRLARELVERFWEGLHPMPDEEGAAGRVSELAGLNGADRDGLLVDCIHDVPLTEGSSAGPFVCWQYRKAESLEAIADPDRRQRLSAEPDAVTSETIRQAEAETSAAFSRQLREDLQSCLDEFGQLDQLLEQTCGTGPDGEPIAPPTSRIRGALKECLDIVEAYAGGAREAEDRDGDKQGEAGKRAPVAEGMATGKTLPTVGAGEVRDREHAFQLLLGIAEFFRRTEPHSPISYVLRRAVEWGRMPLPKLFSELIDEEGMRSSVFKLVGIPPEESPVQPQD